MIYVRATLRVAKKAPVSVPVSCPAQFQTLGPKPLLRAPVPFRFMRLPGLLPHRRSNPETQLPRDNQTQVHIKALPRQLLLCEYLSPLGAQTIRRSAHARKPPD
ncbi:hypothetical protein MRX96_043638 [Rhipicephalus microplus]